MPGQPNGDDSKYWKLGVFYFNSKDKRLLPPKRYGLGWTVNFANPYSIVCLIFIIAVLIFIGRLWKNPA
jgi:uncharacterized membrane protein